MSDSTLNASNTPLASGVDMVLGFSFNHSEMKSRSNGNRRTEEFDK